MSTLQEKLSSLHQLSAEIQIFKNLHIDMTFTIPPGTTFGFKLNPQEYQRTSEPVETELPTATSWYTFRWQVKPPLHVIQVYCGFEGQKVDTIMDNLEGLLDVVWSWPYLNISKHVKIMTVTRMRSATSPYGAKYQITMRENTAIIRVISSKVKQFRINDSFLAPQVYTPTDIGTTSTAFVDVQTNWSSLIDAAMYIAANIPSSRRSVPQQYDDMLSLNNNLKSIDGWLPNGPVDINNNSVTRLRYALGA